MGGRPSQNNRNNSVHLLSWLATAFSSLASTRTWRRFQIWWSFGKSRRANATAHFLCILDGSGVLGVPDIDATFVHQFIRCEKTWVFSLWYCICSTFWLWCSNRNIGRYSKGLVGARWKEGYFLFNWYMEILASPQLLWRDFSMVVPMGICILKLRKSEWRICWFTLVGWYWWVFLSDAGCCCFSVLQFLCSCSKPVSSLFVA